MAVDSQIIVNDRTLKHNKNHVFGIAFDTLSPKYTINVRISRLNYSIALPFFLVFIKNNKFNPQWTNNKQTINTVEA